jgi:hypothetical protein
MSPAKSSNKGQLSLGVGVRMTRSVENDGATLARKAGKATWKNS